MEEMTKKLQMSKKNRSTIYSIHYFITGHYDNLQQFKIVKWRNFVKTVHSVQ